MLIGRPCAAYDGERHPMDITIRPAAMGDADAVSALTRAAYAKWVPVIGREPLPMTTDHAAMIREHRVDLLFVERELAALVETVEIAEGILIENLAVEPRYQKRGLGRRMVAHVEQLAASKGPAVVRLYTNALFEDNIRLYLSLGYKIEREESFNQGVIIHMFKPVC